MTDWIDLSARASLASHRLIGWIYWDPVAIEAYAQLAQKNNTMIVPGNMTEVSALIGTAMALMKKG